MVGINFEAVPQNEDVSQIVKPAVAGWGGYFLHDQFFKFD
jgi:hypothetical protein